MIECLHCNIYPAAAAKSFRLTNVGVRDRGDKFYSTVSDDVSVKIQDKLVINA